MSDKNVFSGGGQIRKSLLRKLFSGFYMLRWNDKLRPCPLVEIDKQAHKMIIASLLLTRTKRHLDPDKFLDLGCEVIEGALFDYFFRMVITDIKPPIYYHIKTDKKRYKDLVHYGLCELKPILAPMEQFWERCTAWLEGREGTPEARTLLEAAHMYASRWEFRVIRPHNRFDSEMPNINADFRRNLMRLAGEVEGLRDILGRNWDRDDEDARDGGEREQDTGLAQFASFCGQLRFQVRWTQIPRIPQTSVLGHMFFVGALAYLFSLTVGACRARRLNNFLSGLFHDLPELLTRDIISPVKKSSDALGALIRDCEGDELEKRIMSPLRNAGENDFVDRLTYYLGLGRDSEFLECVRKPDGRVRTLPDFDEMQAGHNRDDEDPLDGVLVKACDKLAAFMEAEASISSGIHSPHIEQARVHLRDELADRSSHLADLRLDSLLADFD